VANFGILAKLGVDGSGMTQGLNQAGKEVDGFGKRIGSAVVTGVKVAAAAIAAMTAKGVADFMSFEKKMAEVFTLMPDLTADAEAQMTADMRNLAKTMGIDLIDATNALYQAISAGVDKDNALEFLETAAKASIAGVSDLETSVAALTTIMNGYGMSAGKAEEISDVLFSTVKIGVTNFTELGDNIGKVTPLTSELGISIQEVGAMMAVLTKNLGKGKTAEAGTQLKSMLAELSKEGMKAFDNFVAAAGTTFPKFVAAGGSVGDALQILTDKAKASDKTLLAMFRGVEAGMGALTLAADESKTLATAFKLINKDAGSMGVAFEKMEGTASRNWDKMKSGWNDLLITMGAAAMPLVDYVLPALRAAFEVLAGVVITVTEFFQEHPILFKRIANTLKVLVAGILGYNAASIVTAVVTGAATVAMKALSVAARLVGISVKTAGTAMKFSPFGAVLGVLAAVAAAFSLLGGSAEESAKKAAEAAEKLKQKLKAMQEDRRKSIEALKAENDELFKQRRLAEAVQEAKEAGASDVEASVVLEEKRLNRMRTELKTAERMKGYTVEALAKSKEILAMQEAGTRHDGYRERDILTHLMNEDLLRKKVNDILKLENEITAQAEKLLKLQESQRKERENRIKNLKQAKNILGDSLNDWKLTQTEMGKAMLMGRELDQLERRRAKIMADIKHHRRTDLEAVKELGEITTKILNKEKELEKLLKNKRDALLQEEIQIHQDTLKVLDDKLEKQKEIWNAAKGAADEAERELKAQNELAQKAGQELKALGKEFGGEKFDFVTGERKGVGAFKLSSAKLRERFREMQKAGQLPEGVNTLRDFRKHVEEQIKAAGQKVRQEKAKAAALAMEAKKQRQLQEDAALKIKGIEEKINNARMAVLAAEEKMVASKRRLLKDVVDERFEVEKMLKAVMKLKANLPFDPPAAAAFIRQIGMDAQRAVKAVAGVVVTGGPKGPIPTKAGQRTHTTESGEVYDLFSGKFLGMASEMESSVDELEIANSTLRDIRGRLEGFFVNQ
tara:strand:+ start:1284 stop:4343 length:3060 start_codon:yes stop_codon:yes gene_type:complete